MNKTKDMFFFLCLLCGLLFMVNIISNDFKTVAFKDGIEILCKDICHE